MGLMKANNNGRNLTPDRSRKVAADEWQLWTPDFGEEGQRRLKGASVLVTALRRRRRHGRL